MIKIENKTNQTIINGDEIDITVTPKEHPSMFQILREMNNVSSSVHIRSGRFIR